MFSLLALALAPFAFEWRTRVQQDRIQTELDPLREMVRSIETSESEQVSAYRGFQLSGDTSFIRDLRDAAAEETGLYAQAVRLADPLGPEVRARLAELRRLSNEWREPRRTSLAAPLGTPEWRRSFVAQQDLYEQVQDAADRVEQEIDRIEEARLKRIDREETIAQVMVILLSVVGLASAVAVVRLGQRERTLAEEAHRLAREEAALRRATAAVSAGATTDEVIQSIAQNSLLATSAETAFVERIDPRDDTVTVVAASGANAPPPGERIPYPGSFAHFVIERGKPKRVADLAQAGRPVPGDLARVCAGCPALVVPLDDEDESLGALVLVRGIQGRGFSDLEVARAQAFADLATVAFRRVRLMEEAQKGREELERATESRVRLLRGFSHDVKNPLGAADGHASLLEMGVLGDLTSQQLESVSRIRASIRSALELIGDLLELARAEAGQIEVQRKPVDVRLVAKEMAAEYHAQAAARGLRLQVESPPDLPAVETDPVRARQIMGNLISNAVKYTPDGSVTVRVAIRQRDGESDAAEPPGRGRWVAMAVEDTGPGIPAEQHGQLFREFGRLSPSSARGFGLGLAISQRVATALGGCITVDSEEGRGSTFTLWLPADGDGQQDGRAAQPA